MQSFTVTYVPVDQSQSMISVIVLAPPTTVDIGDLMKGTYYNVTVYANNSVGRSPDSNTVTRRTDIDRKLLCYMSIYYFVCHFVYIIHPLSHYMYPFVTHLLFNL